jgi:hypothetical protein
MERPFRASGAIQTQHLGLCHVTDGWHVIDISYLIHTALHSNLIQGLSTLQFIQPFLQDSDFVRNRVTSPSVTLRILPSIHIINLVGGSH